MMRLRLVLLASMLSVACRPAPREVFEVRFVAERRAGDVVARGRATALAYEAGLIPAGGHMVLAAARAWVNVATELLERDDAAGARAAALAGVDELGWAYEPRRYKDDTGLMLRLADDREAEGDVEAAARYTISVVNSRIWMYLRAHRGEVE